MSKIQGLAYNTETGDIYVYLNGQTSRRRLRKNRKGYFVNDKGQTVLLDAPEDVAQIKKFIEE